MIHLRIISPSDQSDVVLDLLRRCPSTTSIVAYRGAAVDPAGDVISCDVAEEDASYVVADLRAMRIHERGSIDLERIDATVSNAAVEAEEPSAHASPARPKTRTPIPPETATLLFVPMPLPLDP